MRTDLVFMAFVAGVLIAIQSALSGQLSIAIKNPTASTFFLYSSGFMALTVLFLIGVRPFPSWTILKSVPVHLYIVAGVISSIGLTLVYYVMPKLGLASTLVGVICGQLFLSLVVGHFGWFGLPQRGIDFYRVIGALIVVFGVYLVNKEY